MEKTLFQKIMDREIPASFVYEDDLCIAILDIQPKAPIHYLIIPREPIKDVSHLEEKHQSLMGHLVFVAKNLAKEADCKGFRLQINNGEKAGQTVFHLHLHLMGWH